MASIAGAAGQVAAGVAQRVLTATDCGGIVDISGRVSQQLFKAPVLPSALLRAG